MLSKHKRTKIAISQWSAENGIIENFIMNVCVQLVMLLGSSTILL